LMPDIYTEGAVVILRCFGYKIIGYSIDQMSLRELKFLALKLIPVLRVSFAVWWFAGISAVAQPDATKVSINADADQGAGTNNIQIFSAPCSGEVSLVASGSSLSVVLAKMAESLEFKLQFSADEDRLVDVDLRGAIPEVVEKLGRADNIIIASEPDHSCDGAVERITQVWILGTGPEVSYVPARATAAPAIIYPKPASPPVLPVSTQVSATGNEVAADETNSTESATAENSNKKPHKGQSGMSPEERYYFKIERENNKKYGD